MRKTADPPWMIECLALIQARYTMRGRDMTPAAVDIYRAVLMRMDPSLARVAVANAVGQCRHLPEPHEIREEYEAAREQRARTQALPAGAIRPDGRPIERFEPLDPAETEQARAEARAHIRRLLSVRQACCGAPAISVMPDAEPIGDLGRRDRDGELKIDLSRVPNTRPDDPIFNRWPHLRAAVGQVANRRDE